MSDYIKGVQVGDAVKQYDYDALGNKPDLVQIDTTLSASGKAADAKVVGKKFAENEQSINNTNTKLQSVIEQSANVLKGVVSGEIVRVDDVSPVKHNAKISITVPDGVDMMSVTITKCGKNLLTLPYSDGNGKTVNGVTYSVNPDGSVHAKGTATAASWFTLSTIPFETIIPSFWNNVARQDCSYNSSNGVTSIFVESGTTVDRVYYPQIEIAKEISEFETGVLGETYTPDADGVISDVGAVSPTMTLFANVKNLTIECEYNQDTNAVIKKLTDAIIALGGTL